MSVLGWLATAALGVYGAGIARARLRADLATSAYSSPRAADAELDALARAHSERCRVEIFGRSSEGRDLRLLRIGATASDSRLLVTAHLHAVEYVGAHVARAVARALLERAPHDDAIGALLGDTEVIVAPQLNPDGAERVWRRGGWCGMGGSRFTARGVDPNRNFPFVEMPGARKWNSARSRPGAAYYRGPQPLSEPECLAIAQLCARERFAAALHFHSFGGIVYLPALEGVFAVPPGDRRAAALGVFLGTFQSRQAFLGYRPVRESPASITGQLDAFLLGAFGTPSVTVEVGRPGLAYLKPSRVLNFFWLSNPEDPDRWARNDVDATLHALCALRARSGGRPGAPLQPELAGCVPPPASERA